MPEINLSRVIAHEMGGLKTVEKFLRKPGNLARVQYFLSRIPKAPVEEIARDREQPRSTGWNVGLKPDVIKAVSIIRGDFIYSGIEALMLQNGHVFKTTDRRNAINGVLRGLVGTLLVVVRKGEAGKPTIYRQAVTPEAGTAEFRKRHSPSRGYGQRL
jgi:hypothetical protein